LKTPGITVQGFQAISGHRFNNVFFDRARVPKSAMVGEENRGWYVTAANLDFERSGIDRVITSLLLYERLIESLRGHALAPTLRNRLAEMAIEFQTGRLLCYRVSWLQSLGRVPNYEASVSKVYGSELQQRLGQVCMETLGMYGSLSKGSPRAMLEGKVAHQYLNAVAATIMGGTSEIQRGIIATRGFGLPR